MNEFWQRALQALGHQQKVYQSAFGEGSPGHLALRDLAEFSRAFEPDIDGISHDQLMVMHGRRQVFFRIVKNVKLSPNELELVYRTAIVHRAARQHEGDA